MQRYHPTMPKRRCPGMMTNHVSRRTVPLKAAILLCSALQAHICAAPGKAIAHEHQVHLDVLTDEGDAHVHLRHGEAAQHRHREMRVRVAASEGQGGVGQMVDDVGHERVYCGGGSPHEQAVVGSRGLGDPYDLTQPGCGREPSIDKVGRIDA